MSEQRPCRYQVGDRVIYGGASGCAPMYEGYGATVVAIGSYFGGKDIYELFIRFDQKANCYTSRFSTLEYRVQPAVGVLDFDITELL